MIEGKKWKAKIKMIHLSDEARAARAKYMREWRRKNAGKQSEYDAKKWEKKGMLIRQERNATDLDENQNGGSGSSKSDES